MQGRPGQLALAFAVLMASSGPVWGHGTVPGQSTGILSWSDTAPLGISYEFVLNLSRKDTAEIIHFVGAKSWAEPENPDGLKSWTHTCNWIALDLLQDAKVKIVVQRQQGVVNFTGPGWPDNPDPNARAFVTRSDLVPAVSLYSDWDEQTENEPHVFNGAGNFWSNVQHIAHDANPRGRSKATVRAKLRAGRYSIAIGGNPPSLGDPSNYPPQTCNPNGDAVCYRYTGEHGYRVTIRAK